MGKVMVIMGSMCDKEKLEPAIWLLIGERIDVDARILSAQHNHNEICKVIGESDAEIFIVGSNGSNILAGIIASLTVRPVIVVPLSYDNDDGNPFFLATQMPKALPMAMVAIDDVENAAILALQILGIHDVAAEDSVYRIREETRIATTVIDKKFTEEFKKKRAQIKRTQTHPKRP